MVIGFIGSTWLDAFNWSVIVRHFRIHPRLKESKQNEKWPSSAVLNHHMLYLMTVSEAYETIKSSTSITFKGIARFCCSGSKLSVGQMCCDPSTKARMRPIRLQSIHSCCQIISHPFRGLGKVVPKMVILGKISVKFGSCLSQTTQIISPGYKTESSTHWACANWLHFLLSENISAAATNQHNTFGGPVVGQIILWLYYYM